MVGILGPWRFNKIQFQAVSFIHLIGASIISNLNQKLLFRCKLQISFLWGAWNAYFCKKSSKCWIQGLLSSFYSWFMVSVIRNIYKWNVNRLLHEIYKGCDSWWEASIYNSLIVPIYWPYGHISWHYVCLLFTELTVPSSGLLFYIHVIGLASPHPFSPHLYWCMALLINCFF